MIISFDNKNMIRDVLQKPKFLRVIGMINKIIEMDNAITRLSSVNKFVTFVILNLALSTSSLYYSISINEIPYGLLTLIAIYLSLSMAQTKANPINVKLLYIDEVILAISQFLWGASIALWYNLIYLQLSIGLSLLLVYLLSSF
ncbi:hypothetical protein DJ532_15620, partial [Sulfolobus sp. A20-N-F8]